MNIPFIKYIEALAASKKYTLEDMVSKVKALGVTLSDKLDDKAIAEVVYEIQKSNPEYFKDPNSLPDPEWLQGLGISKMVAYLLNIEIPEGTAGIAGAFEILNDPDMYQTMSSLALSKVNQEDIELIVNGKYNIHYTTEDINEFIHYFFDVRDWTLSEKKKYINFVQVGKLKNFYELAMDGDKDYLLWKLGIAPDKSFDSMLRDMAMDAYYMFKEKARTSPEEAQKWGSLSLSIKRRLEESDKDTESKRNLFEDIEFILSSTTSKSGKTKSTTLTAKKIPHINELKEEN